MNQTQSSVSDRIWAALMLFTRLPLWKFRKEVPQEAFRHVVEYWTLSGWITGGTLAVSFWLCSQFFPTPIALLLALTCRMLLTGALHEDGLADFADGFGGGHSRERILAIMKDSHIGTFGVLGLGLYLALLYSTWLHLPEADLPFYLLAGDLYAKACSSQIICFLPYARRSEESKIRTTYHRPQGRERLLHLLRALLQLAPLFVLGLLLPVQLPGAAAWLIPPLCVGGLTRLFHARLQGYTGDCCGAVFLLSELSFHLALLGSLFPFIH